MKEQEQHFGIDGFRVVELEEAGGHGEDGTRWGKDEEVENDNAPVEQRFFESCAW